MEVRAVAKDTGISPKKVRPIVDVIRGKKVDEALTMLRFIPMPAAHLIAKTVKSAAANADTNFQMERDNLKIVKVLVDAARTLKRHRPQPRGRVNPILRRSCHITVIVDEQGD